MRNRVLGVLAVARSLGDHGIMKEFVVGKPYVDSIDFDHGEGEFIILACDGLFDVMDDQEAVDLVRNVKGREGAAQMLCNEAIKRGSTDNVTVIVSWL
jgi:serine/threonine protein phosphatase PrpC